MKKTKWKISERKDAPKNSQARVLLSGTPPGGKRVREFFASRTAAEARKTEIETDIARAGVASVNVSAAERRELASFKTTLAPYGKTVADAVAFYAAHLEAQSKQSNVTVWTAVGQLLDRKRASGLSRLYLADLKTKTFRFAKKFGTQPCSSISTAEIRKWFNALKNSPVSKNDFRRVLGVLFNFAKNEGFCTSNPIANIEAVKEIQTAPGIVRADTLPAILRHVRDTRPAMLPAAVIQLFTGLRTAELCRLKWEDIHLDESFIEVNAAAAKNSIRRPVHIEKNLLQWLVSLRKPSGLVTTPRYVRFLTELKKDLKAKKIDIPHNSFRHSFGTYFFALNGNTHTTADQMGNSPKMVKIHYRAAASKMEAEKWFAVTPESLNASPEIVPFQTPVSTSENKTQNNTVSFSKTPKAKKVK